MRLLSGWKRPDGRVLSLQAGGYVTQEMISTASVPTYAFHASPRFNAWMHEALTDLATDVSNQLGSNLAALVLGGGYGRGEGGLVVRDGFEAPYNDVDLVLVVHRRTPMHLKAVQHRYEHRLGVAVDFSRPLTVSEAASLPPLLMWHELVRGHVRLAGDAPLACSGDALAPIEATRLLLNRGAGLLWAWRVQAGLDPVPDADFIRRNGYKAALALGDALLLLNGGFDTSYRIRRERLLALAVRNAQAAGIVELYQQAVRFKFSPDGLPPLDLEEVTARWTSVFLAIESHRCGRTFASCQEYAVFRPLREPGVGRLARMPLNVWHHLQVGAISARYPRETLYRMLPLWLSAVAVRDRGWQKGSARTLWLWHRYNG